jgi:hypothetical protein
MSVTNTVETRFSADAAGYITGVKASIAELEKFIKTNQKAGQAVKKGGAFDAGGIADFINKNRTLGDLFKNTAKAIAGINPVSALAVASIGAIGGAATLAAKEAINFAEQLNAVSLRTGATVESLSTLGFAAEQSEASFADLQVGLRNLQRQQAAATQGNKAAARAFQDLGIETKNLANIPVDQLFRDVAQGVASLGSNARKTAISAQLLGRFSGPALVPLLKQGEAGIKALEDRLRSLGGEISGNFVRQADTFGDQLKELKSVTIGYGQAIGTATLPALNLLIKAFVDAIAPGKDLAIQSASIGTQLEIMTIKAITSARILRDVAEAPKNLGKSGLGALKVFGAELDRMNAEIAEAEKKFDDLFKPRPPLEPTPDDIEGTTTALEKLVTEFTALDKAVDPVVNLAKSLAGVFPDLNPRFATLVEQLKGVANTGPEAAKALERVVAVAAQAQSDLSDELGQSVRDLTGGGDGVGSRIGRPLSRQGERREAGVQGPLTQEQTQGVGEPLGAADEGLASAQALQDGISGVEKAFIAAQTASDEFFKSTIDFTQVALQAMDNFATSFADAFVEGANISKLAFGSLFKQIFKDLAKAIIRALLLKAILGIFNATGLGSITKLLSQGAQGTLSFQDQESSIMGRAAQARGIASGLAGPALAAAPAAGANSSLTVQIHEPGPLTWSEITDRKVLPRLRERQRRLNEQPL